MNKVKKLPVDESIRRTGLLVAIIALLLLTPLLFAILFIQCIIGSKERTIRIILGLDQTWNAALGGNEDETISGRVGHNAAKGIKRYVLFEKVIDLLLGKDHCKNSRGY